jgi:hypothetical protein
MDRLLVIKLQVQDCEAEVLLNGMPIVRANAARPCAIVPVHEYAVEGVNQLEMVLWPHPAQAAAQVAPPQSIVSTGKHAARVHLLLPRIGNPVDEHSARTLGQIDWAPPAGASYEAPLTQRTQVTLPAGFPRWRWFDAPPVPASPTLRTLVLAFIQDLAQRLSAGDVDPFLQATRLRSEELAVAYQQDAAQAKARLRDHLAAAAAAGRLNWLPMDDSSLVMRPVAHGRLVECLDVGGSAMLRTVPDAHGCSLALPLRLACVEQRLYVLR